MYIGNSLQVAFPTYKVIDDISGSFNGSTTSFALLVSGTAPVPLPLNSQQCLISVGGVIQRPDDTGSEGFRLSGGNIVFSSAPSTGEDFFGVILAGADYVNVGANFPDGSVGVPSITFEQDSDTGFYRSGSGAVSFSSNAVQTAILGSNSLTAPSFIPTSSTIPANGVYLPAANSVGISTNSNERLRINSSGNVGIGTTSPATKCVVSNNGAEGIEFEPATLSGVNQVQSYNRSGASYNSLVFNAADHRFAISGTSNEKARIDSSGRLLVGTSTARTFVGSALNSQFQIEGTNDDTSIASITRNSNNTGSGRLIFGKSRGTAVGAVTVVQSGDNLGAILFEGTDGTDTATAASIDCVVDGTPGANDMPGRLVFSVTSDGASSPTERMRITSDGTIRSSGVNGSNIVCINNGVTSTALIYFQTTSTELGKIRINGAGVAYDTTSDYRLKENIEPITDAVARLQALKPWRFNFTSHPDVTVDGFLAHEAQEVVPEAVGGHKDEEDADGNPVYQGIDQSKLVPLLTAALQEAIGEIESLKARLTAAGI